MKFKIFVAIVLLISGVSLKAQELPVHVDEVQIYDFLDELSLLKVIQINSAIKPYSSVYIYTKLLEGQEKRELLSGRQRTELNRHLAIYSKVDLKKKLDLKRPVLPSIFNKYRPSLDPVGFFYKDSSNYFNLQPIWGINYAFKSGNRMYHRWGGVSFQGKIGENFSFYANIRDNKETEALSGKTHLLNRVGANYKAGNEYSEMRGGLNYGWQWGYLSLVKDHLSWGSHSNGSNIFSKKPPSFTQLKLNIAPVEWFEFNYFHGWLVSNVIDSTHSYWTENGNRRNVLHPKFLAANMFTFRPFDHFHLSFGNSSVYSSIGPHPAYFIPFMFYKSVDHWLNSTDKVAKNVGQNSQMFANISVIPIKGLELYSSIYIDEFKAARIKDPETINFWSYKVGLKYIYPRFKNLRLSAEYTRTNPITYQHVISTTTFESNEHNIGHYLRDNSDEVYLEIAFSPLDKAKGKFSFTKVRKGEEYPYLYGQDAIKNVFMKEVLYQNRELSFTFEYEILYNTFISSTYQFNDSEGPSLFDYSPTFYQGKNHIFFIGFKMGI